MRAKRILVVDDSKDDVELLLAAMDRQMIACEVAVAQDGQEALDYLWGLPVADFPAIVLLDLKMPGIDGLTLLRLLRCDERTRLLPVIIFSSSDTEQDIRESYLRGCNSYVHKPVEFARLCGVLRDLTSYWLDWNQTALQTLARAHAGAGPPSGQDPDRTGSAPDCE